MSDAFWGILISTILIVLFVKSQARRHANKKSGYNPNLVPSSSPVDYRALDEELAVIQNRNSADKAQRERDKIRERDIADLKRQGYTDELIAVIIPTINSQ